VTEKGKNGRPVSPFFSGHHVDKKKNHIAHRTKEDESFIILNLTSFLYIIWLHPNIDELLAVSNLGRIQLHLIGLVSYAAFPIERRIFTDKFFIEDEWGNSTKSILYGITCGWQRIRRSEEEKVVRFYSHV
jgi:hypothetical protein